MEIVAIILLTSSCFIVSVSMYLNRRSRQLLMSAERMLRQKKSISEQLLKHIENVEAIEIENQQEIRDLTTRLDSIGKSIEETSK